MAASAGRINKLFGTDGGLMLSLYSTFPDNFDPQTMPLMVTIDALEVPLWCDRFERRGIAGATASFADFDTERRAQELIGLEFRVDDPADEQDDEFYLEDLIGFEAVVEEAGSETKHAGIVLLLIVFAIYACFADFSHIRKKIVEIPRAPGYEASAETAAVKAAAEKAKEAAEDAERAARKSKEAAAEFEQIKEKLEKSN